METWGETHIPSQGRAGNSVPDDPFKAQHGLHSSLSWFWTVNLNALRVQIEPSVWVSNVLPGFGTDSHRLIEVSLPPIMPGSASAAKAWDEALRAYDARNYPECVSKCRAIIAAWNKKAGRRRVDRWVSLLQTQKVGARMIRASIGSTRFGRQR
jgi:hypothetical protein